MIKKTIYLLYYLKNLDWLSLNKFLNHTSKISGSSKTKLLINSILNVYGYNISILEYFQFNFFNKNSFEKKKWAGTGYMYEYQLKMNPISERKVLDDKRIFLKYYKKLFIHTVACLEDLKSCDELTNKILNNSSGKIVFKTSHGKCGLGIEIRNTNDFDKDSLADYMTKKKFDLAEEFIVQHPHLKKLSPSGVNTTRIITQLDHNDEVKILGCRQRISVDSDIDNMAAGNIAANIDEKTGVIIGVGVYSDITKNSEMNHPITKEKILNFQIPFWEETIKLAKKAAKLHPQNRSVGWDIVITDKGPGLIEGNHDWCKLLWQLPVKRGLKFELENIKNKK